MKKKIVKSMTVKLLVLCMCMGLLSPMAVAAAEAGEGEAVIAADEIPNREAEVKATETVASNKETAAQDKESAAQKGETTPADETAGFEVVSDGAQINDVASAEEDVVSEGKETFADKDEVNGSVDEKEEINGDPTVIEGPIVIQTDLEAVGGFQPDEDGTFYIEVTAPEGVTANDYVAENWFEGEDGKVYLDDDGFKAGRTYSYLTVLHAPDGYVWNQFFYQYDDKFQCTNYNGDTLKVIANGIYYTGGNAVDLEILIIVQAAGDYSVGEVTFNVDDSGYDVTYPYFFNKNTAMEYYYTGEELEIKDFLKDEYNLDWNELMEITGKKDGKTYVLRWMVGEDDGWILNYYDEYFLYGDIDVFNGLWVEQKSPVKDDIYFDVPVVGAYNSYDSAPPFTTVFDVEDEFNLRSDQVYYYLDAVCYDDGSGETDMVEGETFEEGVTYTAYLDVYPNWTDGYYYYSSMAAPAITINEKPVTVEKDDDQTCYHVEYTFIPTTAESFNVTLDYNLPTGESKTRIFTGAPEGMMIVDICKLLLCNITNLATLQSLSEDEMEVISQTWQDFIPQVEGYSACDYFTYKKCTSAEDYYENALYGRDRVMEDNTAYICWAKDLETVEIGFVDDLLCGDYVEDDYDEEADELVQLFTGTDRGYNVYFDDYGIECPKFIWVDNDDNTKWVSNGYFLGDGEYTLKVYISKNGDEGTFGFVGKDTKVIYNEKTYPVSYDEDEGLYAVCIPVKAVHVIPEGVEPVIENYKAPKCTEDGSQDEVYTFKCEFCGDDCQRRITQLIESPGHSWTEWKTTKEATETEPGLSERECTVCHTKETDVIPAGNGSTDLVDPSLDPSTDPSTASGNIITRDITFKAKGEKNKTVGMTLTYNSLVTYNGQKHVSKDYDKAKKGTSSDLNIKVTLDTTLLKIAEVSKLKYKNNKLATVKGKEPYYTISLKAKKGITKDEKKLVGDVNKELKAMQFKFDIAKCDIGKAKVDITKDKKGEKVKKVSVIVNGTPIKLSKKDFTAEVKNGKAVIKGQNNFTGTYTEK